MTVTKQQQLEWLSKNLDEWKCGFIDIGMSVGVLGKISSFVPYHTITREEWQQERYKMRKQEADDVSIFNFVDDETLAANIEAMKALGATLVPPHKQDNSWHERGEFPPIGCECEYNDAAWGFEDVSVTPMDGDKLTICAKSKTPSGRDCAIFTWVSKNRALLAAASASPAVFRPLRTEREKAIDAACEAIGGVIGGRLIIERLYDAGMLK